MWLPVLHPRLKRGEQNERSKLPLDTAVGAVLPVIAGESTAKPAGRGNTHLSLALHASGLQIGTHLRV